MKPDDVSSAITNALVQGGSQWLVATIVAFLPALWTMTLMLHLGRPYVLRTLRRCGLRLGADVWWMSYLLMRDGLMIITFALSWIFFLPNLVTSLSLPITGSLAAVFLLASLVVKIVRRVDDDANAYRLSTSLLVIGATLYYAPLVFAVEAGSQSYLEGFNKFAVTSSNSSLALVLTWISLLGVTLILGYMFLHTLQAANRSMTPRKISQAAPAAPTQTA
jgi:hypothetical protein